MVLILTQDADGSGQLEVPEFHKLLERIGITVPETAAKEAMEGTFAMEES